MEQVGRINVCGYNREEGLQNTYDEHGAPVHKVSGVDLPGKGHYMILEDDIGHQQTHPNHPKVCLPTRVWKLQRYYPSIKLAVGVQERDSELVKQVALAVHEKTNRKIKRE